MNSADRQEFFETVAAMGLMHGCKLDAPELRLWFELFAQTWTLAEFREAAAYLLQTSRWMPKPAEFFELREGATPDPAKAWGTVIDHARGTWRQSRTCGDPIADSVVQTLGGWFALAMSTERDLAFRRREFVDTYRDFAERDQVVNALPDLRTNANGSARLGRPTSAGASTFSPTPGGERRRIAANRRATSGSDPTGDA